MRMKQKMSLSLLTAAAFLLLAPAAFAETHDPFGESKFLKQLMKADPSATPSGPRASESRPALFLRGYIEGADGTTAAILEIQGEGVYPVRKGDILSLSAGQSNGKLTVHEIKKMTAVVSFGEHGPRIVVR
jgi:hypothetical protein